MTSDDDMATAINQPTLGTGAMSNNNQAKEKVSTSRTRIVNNSKTDPIATALRRLHDDVVAEPVPDEFLRLLSEIDRKIEQGKTAL